MNRRHFLKITGLGAAVVSTATLNRVLIAGRAETEPVDYVGNDTLTPTSIDGLNWVDGKPDTPEPGDIYFDTQLSKAFLFDGDSWIEFFDSEYK